MDVKYGLLLKKSWQDLRNNLIIFLPILFSILLIFVFGIVVVLEVFSFIAAGLNIDNNFFAFSITLIVILLIDFLLLILIGSVLGAMYVGLLNAITTKKKAMNSDMWSGMRKFTGLFFNYNMIKLSIFLVPLIILGLLIGLGFLINTGVGVVLAILLGGIGILYLIAAGLFVAFGFFFILPIMSTCKSNSALDLIKQTLRHARQNLGHVVITWLIVFCINVVVNVVYQFVIFPASLSTVFFWMSLPFILIFILVFIVIDVWLKIFVFNAYFNSGSKKL